MARRMNYRGQRLTDEPQKDWKAEQEEKIDKAINALVGMFESGDMPEAIAKRTIAARRGASRPCDGWSLSNYLIMLGNGTEDARGFRAWLDAGRAVRKGTKSIIILGPVTVADKDHPGPDKKYKVIGFKGVPVHRIEDTDVVDEEQWAKCAAKFECPPPEMPPLFDVAQALGLKVEWHGVHRSGGGFGWYSPSTQEIRLFTHAPSTFLHELAHHVDGQIQGGLKGGQHADQEIVAEMTSATLCWLLKDQHPELVGYMRYAKDYVEHYGKQPAARAVLALVDRIGKVVARILEVADELTEVVQEEAVAA